MSSGESCDEEVLPVPTRTGGIVRFVIRGWFSCHSAGIAAAFRSIRPCARPRPPRNGKGHARHFKRKADARRWLDEVMASMVRGDYVDLRTAKTSVGEWCDTWLSGYAPRRPRTVRRARVHLAQIEMAFGRQQLSAVRPSAVGHGQQSPRRTGWQTATCTRCFAATPLRATTAQVWALHEAVPEHLRPAILLGAFVGLRVSDVDFMRGIVRPTVQRAGEPMKTKISRTPLPIPRELALELAASVSRWGGEFVGTDGTGGQTSTGDRTGDPIGASQGRGAARRSSEPRPAALPRLAAHQQRPGRQGRAAPASAWQREDDAGQLWAHVARQR